MDKRYREQVLKDEAGSSTSTDPTTVEACRELKNLIDAQKPSTSFSCGGSIQFRGPEATDSSASVPRRFSEPVSIFWAAGDDSQARKLVLPITDSNLESSQSTLQQLVDECLPATFGRREKDVFDPEYRRAGKMDLSHFSTNFHPANFGIIENIEKILLPSISTETENKYPWIQEAIGRIIQVERMYHQFRVFTAVLNNTPLKGLFRTLRIIPQTC